MKEIISSLTAPFKYDTVLWATLTLLLLSWSILGGHNVVYSIALGFIAIAYTVLTCHLRPEHYKIATPVLYGTTTILLLCASMIPVAEDPNPWMRIGSFAVSPFWFVGISSISIVSLAMAGNNQANEAKKSVCLMAACVILVLLAARTPFHAIILGIAIMLALYTCGVDRQKIRFMCFVLTILCVSFFLVTVLAHSISSGVVADSSVTMGIDDIKQAIVSSCMPETFQGDFEGNKLHDTYYDIIARRYGLVVNCIPLVLFSFVAFRTSTKLKQCSSAYVRLLGIGTSYLLVAESLNDIVVASFGVGCGSCLIVDCCMYGIVLSCIGYVQKTQNTKEL